MTDAGTINDRLAALEALAAQHNEALVGLVSKVWALSLVNTALLAQLGDSLDRAALRRMALAGLGEGPEYAPAAALIEALTREPTASLVERQAANGIPKVGVPRRLQ